MASIPIYKEICKPAFDPVYKQTGCFMSPQGHLLSHDPENNKHYICFFAYWWYMYWKPILLSSPSTFFLTLSLSHFCHPTSPSTISLFYLLFFSLSVPYFLLPLQTRITNISSSSSSDHPTASARRGLRWFSQISFSFLFKHPLPTQSLSFCFTYNEWYKKMFSFDLIVWGKKQLTQPRLREQTTPHHCFILIV